jgi:hypothetical protein
MMQHLCKSKPDPTLPANKFYEYYNHQNIIARLVTVNIIKTSKLETSATMFRKIMRQIHDSDVDMIQSLSYGSQKVYLYLDDYILKMSIDCYGEFRDAK